MFKLFSDSDFIKLVQASAARKAEASKRIRYYHDEQLDELYKIISRRWSRPEDFRLFCVNVIKKITDKRAMVYRAPPTRVFEGMDQAAGEALYGAMGADITLKRANRLTKLLKTTALKVGWNGTGPTLAVVTPNVLDVVADDPENPTRIIVTHAAALPEWVEYSDWTASGYRRLDFRGRPMQRRDNPDDVNPYDILPFIGLFDRAPDDEFFLPGGDDLVSSQEALNVALVNLQRAVELQSHGQSWATGLTPGDALRSGPDHTIILPEGSQFGFAAPNTPVGACLQFIEFLLRQTAIANDLSADVFDLSKRSESGAAKLMESRDLIEARQDDIELWRRYEARLFEVLKAVVNTHSPGTIPQDARLRVDFGEPQETLSENARIEAYARRISLGMWSPVDALMADNRDLKTREEAAAILEMRKAETARFLPTTTTPAYGTPGQ